MTDPAASVISEPDVGPSLRMVMALPEIEAFVANEISPEPVLVLPVPSRRWIFTSPLFAFRYLVAANDMTASPESRCAFTTPFAVVSFA